MLERLGLRIALLCALGLGVETHSAPRRARVSAAEVAGAVDYRPFGPRVTGWNAYQRCTVHPASNGSVETMVCGAGRGGGSGRLRAISIKASSWSRTAAVNTDVLQVTAHIDLLFADSTGSSLQRPIESLQTAARLSARPAAVLADLSAAFLVRAERTQNARDLWEAVEAADSAVALEPGQPAARYNLALALDRLGVNGGALEAWRAYLTVDQSSGWAGEARQRVRQLERSAPAAARPTLTASAAALRDFVRRDPLAGRLWGWDELLRGWGTAVLARDAETAMAHLRTAEALGAALEHEGRDATLAHAVRVIRATAGDAAKSLALARAHAAYGAARTAYVAGDYAAAAGGLENVDATRELSPPLAAWIGIHHAATLAYAGRLDEAEQAVRAQLGQLEGSGTPALRGTALQVLAGTLLRAGHYQQSRNAALEAVEQFQRAGEREHAAAATYLAGDAEFALGTSVAAYASMHRVLMELREHPSSVWRHNALAVSALSCAAEGLHRTSLRLYDEAVLVAGRMGKPVYVTEARLLRAQLLNTMGRAEQAALDVDVGERLVPRLEGEAARKWFGAALQAVRATAAVRTAPARAVSALDSVVAYNDTIGHSLNLLGALVARADARLALGDRREAAADLDRATALLSQQRASVDSLPLRAALLEQARSVFDRLVMLQVAEGDTTGALLRLERGRTSLARGGPGTRTSSFDAAAIPSGNAVLDYALIGDTLLAWIVAGGRTRLMRQTIRGSDLVLRIERLLASLARGAAEPALREELAGLYDQLVGPLRPYLGTDGSRLTVVADGEIASVPFEALFDARSGRYLIESFTVRFAGSLADASWARDAPAAELGNVLLVANSAFSAREFPLLQPLAGAEEEVAAISRLYRRPEVMAGAAATRERLRQSFQNTGTIHFAGHAVFDDERPEQSYLVLASSGVPGSSRLTAAELGGMDLDAVRLVVLSACETVRSRGGRSGGFTGLAGALLGAGADGVVGSLWRVDDDQTRALMTEFHRAYRASGDAPGALRAAQMALLRGRDARLRSPAAWAGFRYTGQ